MSTASLLRLAASLLVVGGWASGCAGSGNGAVVTGDFVLAAEPATVGLALGGSGTVRFVLTSDGVPVAGQAVSFTFVDTVEAQGATLDPPNALTDATGTAVVTVKASLEAQFHVQGRAGNAEARTLVVVAAGGVGSVVAVPYFAPSSKAAEDASGITGFRVMLFDGSTCAEVVPTHRADPKFPRMQPLPAGGGSVRFEIVRLDQTSAVVARAQDGKYVTVAAGCVDVAGSSLLADGVVDVAVPLYDVVPDPVGSFAVTSRFLFAPPLAAASAVAAPWRDLADCPLDPAQLWLDCTIDALSPATTGDPLDCVPASGPGGEGPLGDALAARRGAVIVDGGGFATGCRGPRDSAGALSLDAILLGLYGSPLPPEVAALPAVASDAAHILDGMTLKSTLTVAAGGAASTYVVTHTLVSAAFGPTSARVEAPLSPLGSPILTAYTTATTSDGQLIIGRHGFTLRLGTAARAAFGPLALENRKLPGDAAGLVARLADLARSADGGATGCDAMDGALCPLVGRSPGCLAAACTAGLPALAARLDDAFDAADGAGLDLYLEGSAPLVDSRLNGIADHLGSSGPNMSPLAVWSADLRTALGRSILSASFDGSRCRDTTCAGGP